MVNKEKYLSRPALRLLKFLHRHHFSPLEAAAVKVLDAPSRVGMSEAEFNDALYELDKHQLVRVELFTLPNNESADCVYSTKAGLEAAERLIGRKREVAIWIADKILTVVLTSIIATVAAAWVITSCVQGPGSPSH